MAITRAVGFCGILFQVALLATGDQATKEGESSHTAPYEAPTAVEGIHWSDTFDGDVWSRWTQSVKDKYDGKFTVERRKKEALVGDVGLTIPEAAKHYGVSASFPAIEGNDGVSFVVQYEAQFQEGLSCGGSYMKLFDRGDAKPADFDNETPYTIMFGPDRCGGTDKVHFILKHRNPKNGVWEEKHFTDTKGVPLGSDTHLYGLEINPDNSFEIKIDGVMVSSGNLLTSMKPPVNPPKEIDDPIDSKPEDWINEPKMDDPASAKPDEWDEDAPMMILDPQASMPEGWLEGSPKKIADPESKMPGDWDEEEDGEWEAPTVDNPACSVGCGEWTHPKIDNPKYKGKWNAPQIDNPEYKGVWSPRQIANLDYFVDETPCVLPRINSIGFDLWTMQGGMLFDNIVIATDPAAAKAFADQSFQLRKVLEEAQNPKGKSWFSGILEVLKDQLIAVGVTTFIIVLSLLYYCCGATTKAPPPPKKKAPTTEPENEAAPKKEQAVGSGGRAQSPAQRKKKTNEDEDE